MPVRRHFVPGHILSWDNMSPGQYVALCPHYFAVQMGDILSQETYCPGSVRRHFVPGDVLSRLATNGNFWTDIDILRTDIDILRTDINILRTDIDILRTDIDICLILVFWFLLVIFCAFQWFCCFFVVDKNLKD